jgi:hypothetical protein
MSFEAETKEESFSSVAIYAEIRMREVIERTADLPRPNTERTAVACDMMFKMSRLFSRYEDLMLLVADELTSSIYSGFENRRSIDVPTRTELESGTTYFELFDREKVESNALQNTLRSVLSASGDSKKRTAEKIISKMTGLSHTDLQRNVFTAWKWQNRDAANHRAQLRRRAAMRTALKWFIWRRSQADPNSNFSLRLGLDIAEAELEALRGANKSMVDVAATLQTLILALSADKGDMGSDSKLWARVLALIREMKRKGMPLSFGNILNEPMALNSLDIQPNVAATQTKIDCHEVSTQTDQSDGNSLVQSLLRARPSSLSLKRAAFYGGSFLLNRDGNCTGSKEYQPKGLSELMGNEVKKSGKRAKEISVQVANALIISIYEAKLKQDQDDMLEGRPRQSLPELTRDLLIRKYGLVALNPHI